MLGCINYMFIAFVNHRKMQLFFFSFCFPFFVWRISSLLLNIRLVGNFVLFQLYLSFEIQGILVIYLYCTRTPFMYTLSFVFFFFWVSSRTVNKAAFHTSFKQQHQAIGPQLRKNNCHFCLMIWKKEKY